MKSPPANATRTRKKTAVAPPAGKSAAQAEATPRASKPRAPKVKQTHDNGDSLLHLSQAVNSHITAEQIAERAYFRWLERGCPMGSPEQDWFDAEQELGSAK